MHQTFDAESEVLPYRRYPLAELQAKWGGRVPLLNTVFSYFDFHVFNDMFDAGKIKYLGLKLVSHNVGFVLNALFFASAPGRKSNQIYFDLAYEAARLNEQEVHKVGEYYIAVIEAMLRDPQARYEQTNVLPAAESQKLLSEWNTTEATYAYHQCLHQLFEQQVSRTPHAPALVFEATSLSYRRLNEQANQLAHALQEHGIVAEHLVWLCMPRSVEMIVGLLAILKVGGVCVPLDPEYPPGPSGLHAPGCPCQLPAHPTRSAGTAAQCADARALPGLRLARHR